MSTKSTDSGNSAKLSKEEFLSKWREGEESKVVLELQSRIRELQELNRRAEETNAMNSYVIDELKAENTRLVLEKKATKEVIRYMNAQLRRSAKKRNSLVRRVRSLRANLLNYAQKLRLAHESGRDKLLLLDDESLDAMRIRLFDEEPFKNGLKCDDGTSDDGTTTEEKLDSKHQPRSSAKNRRS